MTKTIVTHKNPDLDAIAPIWLLVRFDQSRYGDAKIEFVDAGGTYKDQVVDSEEDVVHVDTGHGRFDHHQEGRFGTCATRLVWESLVEEEKISIADEPVREIVEFVNEIDVFADCYYPESGESRFAFSLSEIVPALHRLQIHDNEAVVRMVLVYLDGVYQRLKDRKEAIKAIEKGVLFESVWGKGVAVVTGADDAHKQAQKMGYQIVIVYDPKKSRTSIKTSPKVSVSLRSLYDKIVSLGDDPKIWFYHNSGHIIANGGSKSQDVSATKLSLTEIVEIVKNIKN